MKKFIVMAAAAVAFAVFATPTEARPNRQAARSAVPACVDTNEGRTICASPGPKQGRERAAERPRRAARGRASAQAVAAPLQAPAEGYTGVETPLDPHGNEGVIGGRPAECNVRHRGKLIPYCGCEASRYVFGRARPELFLAYNWIRYFPRTEPAPGMAAARSGHVMVLIRHVRGLNWLVHDGNSGGGLTRRWVRSIRGYVTVNPHGQRGARRATASRSR